MSEQAQDAPAHSPFGPGARVAIRQYLFEGDEVACRELGLGEIARQPRVGERLEIRIRGERGLASSVIQELEVPERGRLIAVTNGRVYVMSRLDLGAGPSIADTILVRIRELLDRAESLSRDDSGQVTQYVRIPTALVPTDEHPYVGVGVILERWSLDAPASKPESLGVCQLLEEPKPGVPMRLRDSEGHVMATSEVTQIEEEDGALEVGTANRRYRMRREGEG